MCKFNAQNMHKICTRFSPNAQYMRKIVLLSPLCNICARFYLFLQCARFAQDCTYFPNVQYKSKILLISLLRNICARFGQNCTSLPNVQYMHKIAGIIGKNVTYHISALNLEWYSLHSYFWIATSFDFFLNKHLY